MSGIAAFYRGRGAAILRIVAIVGGALLLAHPGVVAAADKATSKLEPITVRPSDKPVGTPCAIPLEPPGQRDFILDQADLIAPSDERRIRELATALLNDKAMPIIVVTIESINSYGGAGMSIETFAQRLFDQWGIGHATLHGKPWNKGILLLVSRDDRQARIELGAGWKHDQDAVAQQIMDEQIVPRFRRADFGDGITAGVESLDKMARGLALPEPPKPWWHYLLMSIAVWGVLLAIFGNAYDLYRKRYTDSSGGGGGGDFSGGSFGGGYSGGGGATGAW